MGSDFVQDTVQDTELAADNGTNLHALVQANPLPAPTLFEALPSCMYLAQVTGCLSA